MLDEEVSASFDGAAATIERLLAVWPDGYVTGKGLGRGDAAELLTSARELKTALVLSAEADETVLRLWERLSLTMSAWGFGGLPVLEVRDRKWTRSEVSDE